MSIGKALLMIGIMLRVVAVLLGHDWRLFAVEAFVRLAAAAVASAAAA